ncbi:MAG: MarR family transcriptional regulator [Candidatus Viridilinea halotolerans]|uniref:MarR family transcriptional regulator n=1 Tax=Candidatus Viridilinea halotolerans TaxID=2491704 RepID=A0A426TSR5_9CHLR|nr:MAG: MarR family transcriptional regulator [Candidatus Viridilinea halotolerans]
MTQMHREGTLRSDRTALEEIERSIMQISWLAQRQFMQLLDDDRFRLTLPQFYTLLHLEQTCASCKMSDLAEATHQSAASLTGVVDRLQDKHLIVRIRDERDRRQVIVELAAQGRELLREIKQARRDQMQMALTHLDEREVDALMVLLDRVLIGMARVLERAESSRLA